MSIYTTTPTAKGSAKKVDTSYPPGGSVTTSSISLIAQRAFDSGLSQYRIGVVVVKFYISIPAGATISSYSLGLNLSSVNDADTRNLRVDDYGPTWTGISSADYEEAELAGGVADVTLASLGAGDNDIPLAGLTVPTNGYVILRMGVSGGSPTGLNDLNISTATFNLTYYSAFVPKNLAIDGDTENGKFIDVGTSHIFSWDISQAQSAYEVFYRVVGAGSFSSTGVQTSPTQSHTFASSFFSANNYEWYVIAYDVDGNASTQPTQKTFTAGTAPATPNITAPTGIISTALTTITITSATHVAERYRIKQGTTVIYDTNYLTQTSNSHAMSATYFKNGKTGLEDGVSYTALARIKDSSGGVSAEDSQAFSVVFVPPTTPLLYAVVEDSYINLTIDNGGDGSIVDNTLEYSTDYDESTATGTWAILEDNIDPDGAFAFYECRSGQPYYFRVKANTSVAYAYSAVVNATIHLDGMAYIHDTEDPAGSIMHLDGWITIGGSESSYARSIQPHIAAQDFLNRKYPYVSHEITTSGEQSRTEVLRVAVMLRRVQEQHDALEELLGRPTSLCFRTADKPLGVMKTGSINGFVPSVPNSNLSLYQTSFELIVTE